MTLSKSHLENDFNDFKQSREWILMIFWKKLRSLPNLPDDIILCTVDVVVLYPNIPHDESLSAVRKPLDLKADSRLGWPNNF